MRKSILPQSFQKENSSPNSSILAQWDSSYISDLQICKRIHLCFFQTLSCTFFFFCNSSNRKVIQEPRTLPLYLHHQKFCAQLPPVYPKGSLWGFHNLLINHCWLLWDWGGFHLQKKITLIFKIIIQFLKLQVKKEISN